jgi:hypothetical protein
MYLSRDATISVPENNTQVDFLIKDPENKHLEGVFITLTDTLTSQTRVGLTNAYGTRTFVVEKGHLYQYVISKEGYTGTRGTLDPASVGTRVFVLYRDGATGPGVGPGVTPGPGTTPGGITDHRQAMRESMNGIYGFMPGAVSMAFMLLAFAMLKRGLK